MFEKEKGLCLFPVALAFSLELRAHSIDSSCLSVTTDHYHFVLILSFLCFTYASIVRVQNIKGPCPSC